MSRPRSRSIVQAIALSVPETPSHIELSDDVTASDLRRFLSQTELTNFNNFKGPAKNNSHRLNYPLTTGQSKELWAQYVKTFSYDAAIPLDNDDFNDSIKSILGFQNNLILRHSNNSTVLKKIDTLLSSLHELNSIYSTITKDTREFQDQSNKLLDQHRELTEFHNALTSDLAHFENLNSINSFLNKPGLNKIIKSSRFQSILSSLDSSLAFVAENPDFKDAESYKLVLDSALTKALTLLKTYINNTLNSTYTSISAQLEQTTGATRDVVAYSRFQNSLTSLNKLMLVIYEKEQLYHQFDGLLSDIYSTYFNIRKKLVLSSFVLDPNKPLVASFQDSLSFYVNLVNEEYRLFYALFNDFKLKQGAFISFEEDFSQVYDNEDDYIHDPEFNYADYLSFGSEPFFSWIDNMLEPFHDSVRNRVLKENDIKTLCQMITLLQKYYEEDEDQADDSKFNINYARLFNSVLTDIQARLIFKVQVFIDDNIVKYKPRLDDFKPTNTALNSSMESDTYAGWYPSLKTSVVLLSQIHQLVNSTIFDDLAHGIIHLCISSLLEGYRFALPAFGPRDSSLFLMKNLLILKKNVENFDIEYASYNDVDFDFSGIKDLFNKFKSGTVWSKGMLQIAKDSVPKIVSNMYDARMELQHELRNSVHSFIETIVADAIKPLVGINVIEADLAQVVISLQDNIRVVFESLKNLLPLFLDDALVVNYLIDGIKDLIIQHYEVFYDDAVTAIQSSNNAAAKEGLNSLMEVDSLIDYLSSLSSEVFGIQEYTFDDDDSIGIVNDVSDIGSMGSEALS